MSCDSNVKICFHCDFVTLKEKHVSITFFIIIISIALSNLIETWLETDVNESDH